MKTRLGRLENQVLAYVQMKKIRQVRILDLITPLGMTKEQLREIFKRLTRGKLIAKVNRGVYLFPSQLPLSGVWAPDEALALNALIKTINAAYQVCGPNAFNRYRFDDQIPARVYVYNNRVSGQRKIGSLAFSLIKVADKRLGETDIVERPGNERIIYSSRVRTLVDGVYDWSRFNSLPSAYRWIKDDLSQKKITVHDLIETTMKYGDIGTIRRIGFLLDRLKVDPKALKALEKPLKPTRSFIPWIPGRPSRGKVNSRWGIIDNGDREI